MSDIALINGDIAPSDLGDILVVNDNDDIIQTAINNIMTVYGANQFHPNIGNTVYRTRFKASERGLKEIANACKNAIQQDPRVMNVIEVVARNNSTTTSYWECDISFSLITIDGTQLDSSTAIVL